MKQQILVIHGGDVWVTYDEYIESLKNAKIDLDRLRKDDWKTNLQANLDSEYDVLTPWMPSSRNAKYLEWEILFSKMLNVIYENTILIGHSLGGLFLAKYLSEEKLPKQIKATFLVSAPYDTDGGRKIVDFVLPASLDLLKSQGGKIFLYHSKDDPVVEFSELAKYQKQLPNAKSTILDGRGHFNQSDFPEILKDIKSLE